MITVNCPRCGNEVKAVASCAADYYKIIDCLGVFRNNLRKLKSW